jgi:hypothetical protein
VCVKGCAVSVKTDAAARRFCRPLDFVRTVASWFVWLQQQAFLSCDAPWGMFCCEVKHQSHLCGGGGRHLTAHLPLVSATFAAHKLRGVGQRAAAAAAGICSWLIAVDFCMCVSRKVSKAFCCCCGEWLLLQPCSGYGPFTCTL